MNEILETTAVTLREIPPRDFRDLTEPELIETVRQSLSDCKFRIGEAAAVWCRKYAAGRTDADFGELVGLPADTVNDYRRVWERFGDSGALRNFPELNWTHFKIVLTRDDAETLLDWANTEKQNTRGLIAYKRMIDGEDLNQPAAEDEDAAPKNSDPLNCINGGPTGPASLESLDAETRPTLAEYADTLEREPGETAPKPAAESTPYSPFRADAATLEREPSAKLNDEANRLAKLFAALHAAAAAIQRIAAGRFSPLLHEDLLVLAEDAHQNEPPVGLDAASIAASIRRHQQRKRDQ
jgi:hypothetical protein